MKSFKQPSVYEKTFIKIKKGEIKSIKLFINKTMSNKSSDILVTAGNTSAGNTQVVLEASIVSRFLVDKRIYL